MKKRCYVYVVVSLYAVLVASACNLFMPSDPVATKATVAISAKAGSSKTILPTFPAPASYHFSISGGPTVIAPFENTTGVASIQLDYGTYDFSVEGYNAQGEITCSAISASQVIAAAGASVDLALTPLSSTGTGTMAISLHWPGRVEVTKVEVSCEAMGNPDSYVELSASNHRAALFGSRPAGSYLLKYRLWSGTSFRDIAPKVVQIVGGLESSATINLDSRDLNLPAVRCGEGFTILLKSDGSLWSWGSNDNGQLGDGTTTSHLLPARIGNGNDWVDVTIFYKTVYGIKSDGTLWSWGASRGYLVPTLYDGGSWSKVSAGDNFIILLGDDGGLWSSGYVNGYGQLGQGTTQLNNCQVSQIGSDTDWLDIAAGSSHCLALKKDGRLFSWGQGSFGALGLGSGSDQLSPCQVGTDADWRSIATGWNHSLAIKMDGSLWAWGDGMFHQVGNAVIESIYSPVRIGSDSDWKVAVGSPYGSFAIKESGDAWAWGQGGLGIGTGAVQSVPVRIKSTVSFHSLSASGGHTAGIGPDGSVYLWGDNACGELGNGSVLSITETYSPVRIGTDTDWVSTVAVNEQFMASKANGGTYACGRGGSYRLGTGSCEDRSYWERIGDFTQVVLGKEYGAALDSGGLVWSWGNAPWFDSGATRPVQQPIIAISSPSWLQLASTSVHCVFGIQSDHSLWSWGSYQGFNLWSSDWKPYRIGADNDWSFVTAGSLFAAAIKTDGSLWTWGQNDYYQLGDGTTSHAQNPKRVGTDADWAFVVVYEASALAIKKDGTLWAWGRNLNGVLGDGTTTTITVPTRIGSDTDWARVVLNGRTSLGIKRDGSLYAWGDNAGCFGNGSHVDSLTPQRIGYASWLSVAITWGSSVIGVRTDGSLWAWGNNYNDLLGLGYESPETTGISAY